MQKIRYRVAGVLRQVQEIEFKEVSRKGNHRDNSEENARVHFVTALGDTSAGRPWPAAAPSMPLGLCGARRGRRALRGQCADAAEAPSASRLPPNVDKPIDALQ